MRAAEAEGRNGQHDQAGIELAVVRVVKTVCCHLLRGEIVQQQVCLPDQLFQACASGGLAEIEYDATLVAVEVQEGAAGLRIDLMPPKWTAPARHFPPGRFYLDYRRSQIGQ